VRKNGKKREAGAKWDATAVEVGVAGVGAGGAMGHGRNFRDWSLSRMCWRRSGRCCAGRAMRI